MHNVFFNVPGFWQLSPTTGKDQEVVSLFSSHPIHLLTSKKTLLNGNTVKITQQVLFQKNNEMIR